METPFKKAHDEFFESEQGQQLCKANTIHSMSLQADDIYLKNRLERAFAAGWIACEENAQRKDGV